MLNCPGAKRKAAWCAGSVNFSRKVNMLGDSCTRSRICASRGSCGSAMRAAADRGRLLGDVDADRTPADAAPATDAAAAAVLVVPAPELVRQPLAVARAGVGADRDAVDVAVARRETGIPLAQMPAVAAVERGLVGFAVAETGGADRGAVAAREAAFGHALPARMV